MKKVKMLLMLSTAGLLSSCDLSQIPGLDKRLSLDDSKAIGAACRHSGRALEDCFTMNPMAHQAGVFEGWRDMNDYMTANNIETVKPEVKAAKHSTDAAGPGASPSNQASPSANPSVSYSTEGGSRPRFDPTQLGTKPSSDQAGTPGAASGESPNVPSRPWERNKDGKNTT